MNATKIRMRFYFPIVLLALTGALSAAAEPLVTAPVTRAAIADAYVAEGVMEAERSATVAAQVAGQITDVGPDAGARVRRGDVLMRIDASEAEQSVVAAAADVAGARAAHANARAEWLRTQALFAKGYVSRAVVDQARAALDAAEAGLQAAQAGRGRATVVRDFTTITAPFDGVVAARLVDAGDMAQPGRALISLYDPGALRVTAQVAQSRVALAGADGLSAEIEVPGVNTRFAASEVIVVPAADPRTHTVEVRARMPDGAGDFVPGQFARLHLSSGARPRLSVPASAVLRRGEVTAVYVRVGEDFRMRQIRPGEALGDGRIEVLAGVVEGEQVALDPVRASLRRAAQTVR